MNTRQDPNSLYFSPTMNGLLGCAVGAYCTGVITILTQMLWHLVS